MENKNCVDPYTVSVFGFKNKLARSLWWLCYIIFFRFSFKPMFAWRRFILRLFGAKIGKGCNIYPRAIIWAPWMLNCKERSTIGNDAEIYNPDMIYLGSHAIVSQGAFLCGATHDYDDPNFPFISKPISIGDYAWVCARATVLPGVTLQDGAVLGLGSVATKNLAPWSVYTGIPAIFVKKRKNHFSKPETISKKID